MAIFSRMIYGLVSFASRGGVAQSAMVDAPVVKRQARQARETGIRGETFAYWYLRSHGYVIVARNYTAPGIKGEIDLVGYDGAALAFVEVKTRAGESELARKPEEAVTLEKRRNLSRVARSFLAERRIPQSHCRFDVLAIESRPGQRPVVRLHKGAFPAE